LAQTSDLWQSSARTARFSETHIRKNAQLLHRQIFDDLSKTPAFRRNPLKIKVVREAGLEPASLSAQDP